MKTVTEILMVLAICGMVAGCNKTSRKVYDETPGEKQTAGIGKSVYATEEIDVDAIYEMKEPAAPAPAPAPAAPAPVAAAPAATPASAPAAVPGAVAPAPAAAPAPAVASVAPAPTPTPAPAAATPAAAPAKASEDAAIKQALKDFISAVEKKDKKRFMELISYDKAKDEKLVTTSYASLTAFIELDNAMKAKFNEGVFASIKKTMPQAAAGGKSVESILPDVAMIDSATVKQTGDKADVTAKEFPQPLEMVKADNQWKLILAPLLGKGGPQDPKQILSIVKGINSASKVAMVAMKANKPQPEVAQAFIQQMMMAMMSSGAIKMPKDMPSAKDVEKIKKSLPKEAGTITSQMMKKMQKLAMEGKIDQADIMKAAEIQAKMKAGQKPSDDDSKFITDLKKKYKL